MIGRLRCHRNVLYFIKAQACTVICEYGHIDLTTQSPVVE